jgi:hypothetical protein
MHTTRHGRHPITDGAWLLNIAEAWSTNAAGNTLMGKQLSPSVGVRLVLARPEEDGFASGERARVEVTVQRV